MGWHYQAFIGLAPNGEVVYMTMTISPHKLICKFM